MGEQVRLDRSAGSTPGFDRSLAVSQAPALVIGYDRPSLLGVDTLLALQGSAGNRAVVQMLRPRAAAAPTAPRALGADREERAAGGEPEPQHESLVGSVPSLAGDAKPTRADRTQKRADRDAPPDADEPIEVGGGPYPIAEPGPPRGEFRDRGRVGGAPFGDVPDQTGTELNEEDDQRPHIFIAGGKTGTKAWAGGGGAGPKGNQPSGSLEKVDPVYESNWGGVFDNADAWVAEGTGTVTVKRDYVSSAPGDQGNGWYVTDKAAAALEMHERKHVAKSRSVYVDRLQPLLDRIANSYTYGKGKVYKSVDAQLLVKRYVDWAASIRGFDEDDRDWNAPGGRVDAEDQGSAAFPRQIGPGKVNGKEFRNRLRTPAEQAPPE